jgi:hypothetical protein
VADAEGAIEVEKSIFVDKTKMKPVVATVPLMLKGDRYECEILVGLTRPR